MKAIIIQRFGGPEVLELRSEVPCPAMADNQVLIQVHAAGINPLDWKIRKGELRFLLGSNFPVIPGNDASGTIVATGKSVKQFKAGDAVYGLLDARPRPSFTGFAKSGACAEFAVSREDTLSLKPGCMTHVEAASVPLAALTAYQALRYKAGIRKTDKVLINGASGGVGIFAVQLAKAFGGRVTAVCSLQNQDLVRQLGADAVIDYADQDITKTHEKYDIIHDVVGNLTFSRCRRILEETGVFLSNLPSPGAMAASALFPLLRAVGFKQTHAFAWVRSSGKDLDAISRLIDQGFLRTHIDRIYAMGQVAEAHRYSESGRVRGKLVVAIA